MPEKKPTQAEQKQKKILEELAHQFAMLSKTIEPKQSVKTVNKPPEEDPDDTFKYSKDSSR